MLKKNIRTNTLHGSLIKFIEKWRKENFKK